MGGIGIWNIIDNKMVIFQWETSGSIQGPEEDCGSANDDDDDDGREPGENKQLIQSKLGSSAGRGVRVVVSWSSFISTQTGVRLAR